MTATAYAGSGFTPRQTFGGVLASERIKFTSLRSFQITILITLLAGIGLSTVSAFAWSDMLLEGQTAQPPAEMLQQYLLLVSTFATPFLALIFGVLGVFAMSSEYSSGMILSTLAAVPRRGRVFTAKMLVLSLIAAAIAIVLVAFGLGIACFVTPAAAAEVLSGTVISGALGTIAYLVLIALVAFGLATILRSTAGGIAVIAGLTFVLPVGFQILSMANWEWVPEVSNYLLTNLGSTLSQGISSASAMGEASGPNYWVALAATIVWAVVPLIIGLVLFKRRDAK